MRIHRLAMTGFGPYKDRQSVDFDAFADDGLFLISGKTGAGKSSILDAVSFALFDSVPRYEKTKARLRSDHCDVDDETVVELEFSVGEQRYRVERSPEYERPKRRGSGTTLKKSEARLDRWRDGAWEGVAARPVDVARELAEVIALTKEQFLQVIVLAQNRFQEFLLADSRERERVLRSLFGTERFAAYEAGVKERSDALEQRMSTLRSHTQHLVDDIARTLERHDTPRTEADGTETEGAEAEGTEAEDAQAEAVEADPAGPDAGDAVAWAERGLERVSADAERMRRAADRAEAERREAEVRHREVVDLKRRVARLADARQRSVALERAEADVRARREELAAAERAELVRPHRDRVREAERRLEQAESARGEAQSALDDAGEGAGAADRAMPDLAETGAAGSTQSAVAALDRAAEGLSGDLARLEDALDVEKGLPDLRERERSATEQEKDASTALEECDRVLTGLPSRIEKLAEEATGAQVAGAGADAAAETLDRLNRARTAAERAESLTAERDEARRRELARVEERTHASDALRRLLDARLAGHAAELAEELDDGSPCPVCGSRQHPSKAERGDEAVTQDMIERAQAADREAQEAQEEARAQASRLEAERAAEHAAAGSRSLAQISEELAPAEKRVDEARQASERAEALQRELGALRTEHSDRETERERLRTEREAASATLRQVTDQIGAARRTVEQRRGDHDSVADAAEAIERRRAAVAGLASALRALDDARGEERTARRLLDEAVREHGFESGADAESAMRDARRREELRSGIRRHDDERAAVAEILADDELTDLPDEAPDTVAAGEEAARAETARDEAYRRRDMLADRAEALRETVDTLRERMRDQRAQAEEYERVHDLALALAGGGSNTRRMRLESYVLAAELEHIVEAANGRLATMTAGRYRLEHDDSAQRRGALSGLALAIFDQHTGRARATRSLSGGETFLASLALALGLAEVVTARAGGITLDTLFIDEGFGSLDAETLEVAMSTLDSLRAGGRTVGLISHVEAMKEQIPARLAISIADGGWSEITQR